MNYLSQPIAGLLLLTSQLFSGRVIILFSFCSGWTYIAELLFLTSTLYFQSAAVPGRRNSISQPAQSPVRCLQPFMKQLELPITIRTARIDELPYSDDLAERIQRRVSAKIVEGYTLKENPTTELPFKFYSEINIDNSKLWTLLNVLLFTFPDTVSFIFGHSDEEPTYSTYMDKSELLNKVGGLESELTQDGFIEFGVIYHDENLLVEIFVDKTKYIKYWGTDYETFNNIMLEFDLMKIDDLNFIDEFPLATEALTLFIPDAIPTSELIEQLKTEFTD